MSGADIICNLLKYNNINPSDFAKKIGLKRPQAIYDIQNGKTKNISPRMADKIISVFPCVNRGWLLTGEGEMLRPEHGEQASPAAPTPSDGADVQAEISRLSGKIEAQNRELEELRRLMTGQVSELIRQNSVLLDLLSRK